MSCAAVFYPANIFERVGSLARQWGEIMAAAYQGEFGEAPTRMKYAAQWSMDAFDASWGKIQKEIGVENVLTGCRNWDYWTLYRVASREFNSTFLPGKRGRTLKRRSASNTERTPNDPDGSQTS